MAEKRKMCSLAKLTAIVIVTLLVNDISGAKLNEPKVLLPYHSSTTPSSYVIEIHEAKGCFTWSSSRPDVASITVHDDPACSHSVTVTALHRDSGRVTTFLLAENKESGEVLRCDVIVDSITAIGIETTTRELYLEDSPEKFQIWARDSEGNTFSTLDTIPFVWTLVSDTQNDEDMFVDAHDILRIITFGDSNYDTPPHIEVMESKGRQGDTILVEGIRTGSANVRVRLKDQVYQNVPADMVRLIVIANVMLFPPDAYILLFTSIQYRAHVIKQGTVHGISLPAAQYHLEVKNQSICSLSTDSSEAYGVALGSTHIVLRDKNMPVKLLEAFHQPSASLHVVLPAYISFKIEPGSKWVLESGRTYVVTVELLDKDRHPIYISKDVRLLTEFSNQHFTVMHSTINGSYHVVKAELPGRTDIRSVLVSVITKDGSEYKVEPTLEGSQKLDIYRPVTVEPDVLVFPWVADHHIVYTGQFQASGGSGDYTWSINSSAVADLGPKVGSTVAVKTKNVVGAGLVLTGDVRNALHYDTSQVFVIPPDDMVFNPEVVEVEVGNDLILPLAVFGVLYNERRAFTNCTLMMLDVQVDSSAFVYNADAPAILPADGKSCTSVRMVAKKSGHAVVTASYKQKNVHLMATVTIAAFDPLVPADPEERTILAQGSSRELKFNGGPQPWVLDKSKYFENGRAGDAKVVSVKGIKGSSTVHRLSALCLELGERDVTINVGNRPSATNKQPATRSATIRVYCKEPSGVQLLPQVPLPDGLPPCPVTVYSDSPIPAHNYRNLNIHVVVTDDEGRQFDNISSLHFVWDLSTDSLGALDGSVDVKSSVQPHVARSTSSYIWYQTFTPKKIVGIVTVSLELHWKLKKEVAIHLLDDAVVIPGEATLFNHPDSLSELEIVGGSGHFYKKHEPEKLATVKYVEQTRKVLISPILDGNLRIQILDVCMLAEHPTDSIVRISGAHSVVLRVRDKLQLGKTLTASVSVLDHDGKPLPATHFSLMDLEAKLDAASQRYITITPDTSSDKTVAMFTVRGVGLGTARLSFAAQAQLGTIISSNVQDVQVFPPLRLEPRNVTLLVGAALQVQAVGGPHPQSSIKYTLHGLHENVATVSGNGLVETSSIGSLRIRAQAIGTDDDSGEIIVYSEDAGEIHVVKLMGVKLHAPLSRLQTDTTMPLYAMGVDERQTPFSFGNIFPPLSFRWSITNREVAVLQSVYHGSNIELPDESRFSQQLLTKREGHMTVKLEVSVQQHLSNPMVQQIYNNRPISDEVHMQVFDSMELLSPSTCAGQVLMTPNTEARLRTNRDSAAVMSYKVQSNSNLLTVQHNGDITSGNQAGTVSVLVTAVERFGTNQTLLILVKIKPVSYVMLNCETELKTLSPLNFVPVGSVLRYRVSSHDELGQRFDFTNSQIRFRPNRFDLLQVTTSGSENGTVTVRAPSISPYRWGGTVLKAWDVKQPRIADYVNINVQNAIESAPHYTVGDIMCFTTKLLAASGDSGTWSSRDDKVLMVDKNGYGLALTPGSTVLSYNMTTQITTTQVQVADVKHLQLESVSHSLTLDGSSNNIAVHINNDVKTTCNGVPRPIAHFPYKCELSTDFSAQSQNLPKVANIFTSEPTWAQDTGVYGCSVTAHTIPREQKILFSTVQGSISLTAVSYNDQLTSEPLRISFLPPIYVHTKELYLTPNEPVMHIDVSATPATISYLHVKIEGRLSSVLQHSAAVADNNLYRIAVRWSAYSAVSSEGSITLQDKLTNEMYDIPVHIIASNTSQGAPSSTLRQLLWSNNDLLLLLLFCILVTLICFLVGYFMVIGPRRSQATSPNDSGLFPSSPVSSIGTASPSGDPAVSWQRQRGSPGRVALWSSGYVPQEVNQSDISLFRRSPHQMLSPD